jgi:hypothetical protein
VSRLFTTRERDESTRALVDALHADARVDKVELFGSVADLVEPTRAQRPIG